MREVIIVSQSRIRSLPFRPTEDQLYTKKAWEEWLDFIEREFRYFRIISPADRKDALIIYGRPKIVRLEKCLPDQDFDRRLDMYQKLKKKLNACYLPKRNKHHTTYIFLETKSELGEATVAYATRLREKADGCDFGDISDRTSYSNDRESSSYTQMHFKRVDFTTIFDRGRTNRRYIGAST